MESARRRCDRTAHERPAVAATPCFNEPLFAKYRERVPQTHGGHAEFSREHALAGELCSGFEQTEMDHVTKAPTDRVGDTARGNGNQ